MAADLPLKYIAFTEEDFINDPLFQDWVLRPATENNIFWQQFITAHPDKSGAIDNAAFFLQHLRFEEHFPSDASVQRLFKEHLARIEQVKKPVITPVRSLFKWKVAAAAVLTGILAGACFIFFSRLGNGQMAVTTQFGEKKKVILSDSSAIILNAHSQIKFQKVWKPGQPREVWLEGEAFFSVKHLNTDPLNIKPRERFIIHGKDFTIEVLGTSFNVRQRRGRTEIVLQTGSIKLLLNDNAHTELLMKPGELVSYNENDQQIIRSATTPQEYTAWKENKLVLVNPGLKEITAYLEDNYGKKIIISDTHLGNEKIEGPILLDNLDDALFIITTVLKVKVERTDSAIIIRPE